MSLQQISPEKLETILKQYPERRIRTEVIYSLSGRVALPKAIVEETLDHLENLKDYRAAAKIAEDAELYERASTYYLLLGDQKKSDSILGKVRHERKARAREERKTGKEALAAKSLEEYRRAAELYESQGNFRKAAEMLFRQYEKEQEMI